MSSTGQGVVVTGMGATTPLGGDVATTWDGLLAGRSAASKIEQDWVDTYELPVKIASQLAVDPAEILKRVEARRLDRSEQTAIIAAREAWQRRSPRGEPREPDAKVPAPNEVSKRQK